jgi:hypothetical protein
MTLLAIMTAGCAVCAVLCVAEWAARKLLG